MGSASVMPILIGVFHAQDGKRRMKSLTAAFLSSLLWFEAASTNGRDGLHVYFLFAFSFPDHVELCSPLHKKRLFCHKDIYQGKKRERWVQCIVFPIRLVYLLAGWILRESRNLGIFLKCFFFIIVSENGFVYYINLFNHYLFFKKKVRNQSLVKLKTFSNQNSKN